MPASQTSSIRRQSEVDLALGFPWAELGDRYTFTANNRHFSSDQTLAVCGISHAAEGGRIRTQLQLRGQPALMRTGWHEKFAHPGVNDNHQLLPFQAAGGETLSIVPTVGGARIKVATTPEARHIEEFEHHVSPTLGFTPDASTLVATTKSREVEVSKPKPRADVLSPVSYSDAQRDQAGAGAALG